jgi:para-nitrobenzyl esterase
MERSMSYDERVVLTMDSVRGTRNGSVRSFFAIPSAAPPVGAQRFALPASVEPWAGERDATMRGASAPQRIKDFPGLDVIPLVGDGRVRGGDYLTLNVHAPVDAAARPVMVFIHGGGFVVGSKDASVQDGTTFARDGIVYVAINYRLGIDGFLPIPGVPTNLGLRDMIAALR